MKQFVLDFGEFISGWTKYLLSRLLVGFHRLEKGKSGLAEKLYQGRGKWVRPFLHSGMGVLAAIGIVLAPVITSSFPEIGRETISPLPDYQTVLAASIEGDPEISTNVTQKLRAAVEEYLVAPGDTISGVAQKYGVSVDTILWANDLVEKASIKPGQKLKIPPVTGVVHKVKKGDTIYSLAKYYNTDAQGVVDYPFNTFANDETFELAVGQILVIPDGEVPKPQVPKPVYIARQTPNAGTVVASGQFVWPTSGVMSQGFKWYHRAIDLATASGTPILAADAGFVVVAGWPDNIGYGNRVMLDHGNGLSTLYGHMSKVAVSVGQTVKRGDVIGYVGSTGRSTGPHLHFEIRSGGKTQNPSDYLK